MSDYELKRINALTEASAINDSDVFAIDSAAGTKKVAWETLKGEVDADISEAVSNKADKDGTYPDMAVGSVLGTNTVTDTDPYFLRPSASIGDREFDALVGGSLGWNQLINKRDSGTYTFGGCTFVVADNGTITASGTAGTNTDYFVTSKTDIDFVTDHVYMLTGAVSGGSEATYRLWVDSATAFPIGQRFFDVGNGAIARAAANETRNVQVQILPRQTVSNLVFKPNLIDLTTLFGTTIADYIYSLETAHAGDGVAWVRKYLTEEYYAYCAPTLKHVSGVSAHVMRDANNNVIGNYAIDSTWVGMGIPKLDSANKLYFDGDRYASDGTVTERYGIRAYQSGDESLADAITDGTNTVYKLTTPTTSSASPFTSPQICDPNGTEEYVSTGLVPVGHETEYVENLADKLTDIPDLPTTAGTYRLKVTVSGGVPSYSWVSA